MTLLDVRDCSIISQEFRISY